MSIFVIEGFRNYIFKFHENAKSLYSVNVDYIYYKKEKTRKTFFHVLVILVLFNRKLCMKMSKIRY